MLNDQKKTHVNSFKDWYYPDEAINLRFCWGTHLHSSCYQASRRVRKVTDVRLSSHGLIENLEGKVLKVSLDLLIIIFAADEMLHIENARIDEMR